MVNFLNIPGPGLGQAAAGGGAVGLTTTTHAWWTKSNAVDRFVFASDTDNAADVCNQATSRYQHAAVGDEGTNVWNGGGNTGTQSNVVDKLICASDTDNMVDKCDLTVARLYLAGTQVTSYGYFMGGDD